MRRRVKVGALATAAAVIAIVGATVASAAPPSGTIVVNNVNDKGPFSGLYDNGAGIREITTDLGAPPGGGDGALLLATPRDQDKIQYATRGLNGPLSELYDASYYARSGPPPEQPPSFQPRPAPYPLSGSQPGPGQPGPGPDGNRGPGGDRGPGWGNGPDGNQGPGGNEEPREQPQPVPSFQIVINAAGGVRIEPRQVYVLTYYPESTPGDDWTQENAGAGRFCVFQQIGRADAHRTACADSERRTLPDIAGQFPNAAVLYAGVNVGGGNPGTTVGVDLISANGTTYDFEPGTTYEYAPAFPPA